MNQSINAYNQDLDSTSMSIKNSTEENTQMKNPNYFVCDGITVSIVHEGIADLNDLVRNLFLNS